VKNQNNLRKEFDELIDCVIEMAEVGGKFDISDLIPILKPFDVQGIVMTFLV
jgi:hypothetical protein